MRQKNKLIMAASIPFELLGIATLITNPGPIIPDLELGFSIPVLLINSDIQGFSLIILASIITLYAIYNEKRGL